MYVCISSTSLCKLCFTVRISPWNLWFENPAPNKTCLSFDFWFFSILEIPFSNFVKYLKAIKLQSTVQCDLLHFSIGWHSWMQMSNLKTCYSVQISILTFVNTHMKQHCQNLFSRKRKSAKSVQVSKARLSELW